MYSLQMVCVKACHAHLITRCCQLVLTRQMYQSCTDSTSSRLLNNHLIAIIFYTEANITEAKDVEAFTNAAAAVRANNPDQLRRYVSLPELQNSKGKSLLEMSCEMGHEGCVRVLLEGGWSPNEATKNNWTPLHICAKHGHLTYVH